MPVIAVVNRKGGSGKSTLSAHIAAWCARQGHAVMLGDVDRQQSSRAWLRRRDPALPLISPWAMDAKNVLRLPTGITHVVLDTPGGIHGFELARVVMFADAIVMPVCHSAFDRESAAACHAELMTLPRMAQGRCKLAAVGMRVDSRTRAGEVLRDWAGELDIPFLGVLREAQLYVRSLEKGLTIFDLPPDKVEADLAQWAPIVDWMRPVLDGAPPAEGEPVPRRMPGRMGSSRAEALKPAQETLVHGSRLTVHAATRMAQSLAARGMAVAPVAVAEAEPIPDYLKRAS